MKITPRSVDLRSAVAIAFRNALRASCAAALAVAVLTIVGLSAEDAHAQFAIHGRAGSGIYVGPYGAVSVHGPSYRSYSSGYRGYGRGYSSYGGYGRSSRSGYGYGSGYGRASYHYQPYSSHYRGGYSRYGY